MVHNCRCRFRTLSQAELGARGLKVAEGVEVLERPVLNPPVDPLTGETPERLIERGVAVRVPPSERYPDGRAILWADRGWDHLPGSDGAERALVDRLMAKAATLSDGIRVAVAEELIRAGVRWVSEEPPQTPPSAAP